MSVLANSYLNAIEAYKPGKSKIEGDKPAIKLSSNENALGASPRAKVEYEKAAATLHTYPDGSCNLLKSALAKKYNINPAQITCGAGSDELIALLIMAFANHGDEVIYSEYGFLMYPISAKKFGTKPIAVKEKHGEFGYKADVDAILAAINSKTKIIFVANPNNPTGSYLNSVELQRLIDSVPKNILIALDCAYQEFVNADDYPDAQQLVDKHDNVVMLRTFSKIYGLASLRIGWSYASTAIAEVLDKVRGPFNVCSPAIVAAVAALNDDEFLARAKNHNDKWLSFMQKSLAEIKVLKVYDSVANFVLVDFLSVAAAARADQLLREHGIIVREMAPYNLNHHLRITIGLEEDNKKVVEVLKKL